MEEGSYRCGTCMAVFADFAALKEHYKTDWHRFNLKRKVVQLPPISEKDFLEKVAPTQQQSSGNSRFHCDLCNKSFSSESALKQHLKSKVHLKMVEKKKRAEERRALSASESEKTEGENSLTESEGGGDAAAHLEEGEVAAKPAVVLTHKHCLFCNKRSKTRAGNLAHMAKEHGLFIPDAEYLVNLSGLLDYLIEKVSKHHVCLYCKPTRQFGSLAAVQDHMRSVNHCKLRYETDEEMAEYSDFYDFSSSYEQYKDRMKLADVEDEDEEGEKDKKDKEDGEEGEEGEEGKEEEGDERAVALLEESVRGNVTVTNAGYELIFSNGKAVGHRDFQTYYKQKPRPVDTRESVQIAKMMAEYKMLGYAPPRNERHFIDKKTQRLQSKHHMQVGVKGNKLFKIRLQVREC